MDSWDEFKITIAAYGAVAVVAIISLAAVNWPRQRLLTLQRLRPGYWPGAAVLLQFVLYVVCSIFAIRTLQSLEFFDHVLPEGANELRRWNLASPLSFTLFLAASFSLIYGFNRTTVSRVGLSFFRWRPNVVLGGIGYLIVTPVVFGVFALCLVFVKPEQHQIEMLAAQPLASFEWALLFLQTVVFAPIAEEWLFRGVLQGWLRRTNLLGHAMLLWITISLVALRAFPFAEPKPKPAAAQQDAAEAANEKGAVVTDAGVSYWYISFAGLLATGYAVGTVLLYRPVLTRGLNVFMGTGDIVIAKSSPDLWAANLFEEEGAESRTVPWSEFGPAWGAWKRRSAQWAIYGSSMAWALAHSPWPNAVPLFLLGLALGWLAYRTQNLVPGIVIHSLFNLVSFIVLWVATHPGTIGNDESVAITAPDSSGIVTVAPAVWCPR